ncbi:hypothetical protein EVAR_82024_1 [Eumeta japonica]|uniref:Uncharacterized protein n=1 Tax=Eumeta variegata TaxID=151549 RepID=A0A4C1XMD2_EUMVA|nr:hypothetical protein EVAR_82024_1 [Eumeta japonica]
MWLEITSHQMVGERKNVLPMNHGEELEQSSGGPLSLNPIHQISYSLPRAWQALVIFLGLRVSMDGGDIHSLMARLLVLLFEYAIK